MAPTPEETATNIEEGIPASNTESTGAASSVIRRQGSSRLSLISKKYDVNGDGKLDEAEQAMRDMDKEGLGYLSNDKVYTIFQEQLRMQKQLLMAKRIIIFCATLLIILAAANVGVSFAAANLAKDTSTNNNVLVVKENGQVIQVDTHNYVFDVMPDPARRRELQFYGEFNCATPGNCLIQPAAAAALEILRLCQLELPVVLNYTDGTTTDTGTTTTTLTYHVCNNDPSVIETITVNSNRDGGTIEYNVTRPTVGFEFASPNGNATSPDPWSFTVLS